MNQDDLAKQIGFLMLQLWTLGKANEDAQKELAALRTPPPTPPAE